MKLLHRTFATCLLLVTAGASAQTPASSASESLLPAAFGDWKQSGSTISAAEPAMSLMNANKSALAESNPQRSAVATYTGPGGKPLYVEAVQFNDYSGAWAAYTLLRTPGLKDTSLLGRNTALGNGAVLFVSGATLAVAFPAAAEDLKQLQPLAASFPPIGGARAQAPLLPTFLPARGLAPGSVRYALGPATYSAQGGVLPASNLGWEKSAEAVTAFYQDRRGEETVTLLLYPTPQIATTQLRLVQQMLPGLGPKFEHAAARRDMDLVVLASGTFSAADARSLTDGIHMHLIAATDQGPPPPEFHSEVGKAASLLLNITVLSCVLGGAALLLGLFLGGGRALVRVLRGKPASVEPEFLSLHLENQNPKAHFSPQDSPDEPGKA
ncbi:MAG: hypothetical protein PW735_05965 [Acidobacteriaceae bacterium]|nr:hypothetical protein [Acidobacteriaceae bacterium]